MELTLRVSSADAARLQRVTLIKSARAGRSRGQAARIVWHDSLDRDLAGRGLALSEERGVWRLERHRPRPVDLWPPATDHHVIRQAEGLEPLRQALAEDHTHVPPAAITPVAAFEGRRNTIVLNFDEGMLSLTVLDGTLRAVAAERAATRLIISGTDDALVRRVVLALAETVALSVPELSLANEALHLADGTPARPRRHGAPALPHGGLPVRAAFAHIIAHLTDVIVALAPLVRDADSGPEPVHHMRVAVRRARSAFSLFPPVLSTPPASSADGASPGTDPVWSDASAGLKHLGHMLGPARDWDVFMTETLPPVEAILPAEAALRPLLRAGARRRVAGRGALNGFLASPEFRRLTLELACLAATGLADPTLADTTLAGPTLANPTLAGPTLANTTLANTTLTDPALADPALADPALADQALADQAPGDPALADLKSASPRSAGPRSAGHKSAGPTLTDPTLIQFAAGVLRHRWKKLVNTGKALDDLDGPGLHRLRLKAKRLRYAAEFFAPLFPEKPTSRFIHRLADLQERLGLFNDTAAAESLLRDLNGKPGYAAGLVLGFTAARGDRARPKISAAWTRLRRRDPFWL